MSIDQLTTGLRQAGQGLVFLLILIGLVLAIALALPETARFPVGHIPASMERAGGEPLPVAPEIEAPTGKAAPRTARLPVKSEPMQHAEPDWGRPTFSANPPPRPGSISTHHKLEGSPPFQAKTRAALALLVEKSPTGIWYANNLCGIREVPAGRMVIAFNGSAAAAQIATGTSCMAEMPSSSRSVAEVAGLIAHEGGHVQFGSGHADGRVVDLHVRTLRELGEAGLADRVEILMRRAQQADMQRMAAR